MIYCWRQRCKITNTSILYLSRIFWYFYFTAVLFCAYCILLYTSTSHILGRVSVLCNPYICKSAPHTRALDARLLQNFVHTLYFRPCTSYFHLTKKSSQCFYFYLIIFKQRYLNCSKERVYF